MIQSKVYPAYYFSSPPAFLPFSTKFEYAEDQLEQQILGHVQCMSASG